MADVGRPTTLDNNLLRKIKQSILDGNDLKKTANVCEIPESTLYTWHSDNYLTLADKIEGWRRDRKLMLANENIVKILQLDINDKDFVKTVSDMSKFVAETLDKKNYSKRTENTGADGKDLIPVLVKFIDSNEDDNNSKGVSETI